MKKISESVSVPIPPPPWSGKTIKVPPSSEGIPQLKSEKIPAPLIPSIKNIYKSQVTSAFKYAGVNAINNSRLSKQASDIKSTLIAAVKNGIKESDNLIERPKKIYPDAPLEAKFKAFSAKIYPEYENKIYNDGTKVANKSAAVIDKYKAIANQRILNAKGSTKFADPNKARYEDYIDLARKVLKEKRNV